jgi:hypothetical protein
MTTDNYKPTVKSLKGVKQSFSGKDIYFTLDCPLPRDEEYGHYVLVYEEISLNNEESFKKIFKTTSILKMLKEKSPEYDYSTSFYESWIVRDLVKRGLRQKLIPELKGYSLIEGTDSFILLRNPELLKTFVHVKDGTEYVTFLYLDKDFDSKYDSEDDSKYEIYAYESIIKKNNNIQTQDVTSGAYHSSLENLIPFLGEADPITLSVIPSELDAIAYIKSIKSTT